MKQSIPPNRANVTDHQETGGLLIHDERTAANEERCLLHSDRVTATRFSTVGAVIVLATMAVSGCAFNSNGEAQAPMTASSSEAETIFDGTPDEFDVLLRACLADEGIITEDLPGTNGDVFTVDAGSTSDSDIASIKARCEDAIGRPPLKNLAQDELQLRYEDRLAQWDCLIAEGLVSGTAPSFEVFVGDYERSGQSEFWDPTSVAAIEQNGAPVSAADVCRRSGEVW